MKHTAILLSFFAVGAVTVFSACSSETDAATPNAVDTAAQSAAPVEEVHPLLASLTTRARTRWQLIENLDWIQAYDFNAKQLRDVQDLGSYLSGASDHHYVVKTEPELIGQDGRQAFVQVLVEWTPMHPEIKMAANANDGSLVQDIDMIETWVWEDEEWYFVNGNRARDFIKDHPSLFKRDKSKETPASSETAALEGEELK
jgi:hypothetical protein